LSTAAATQTLPVSSHVLQYKYSDSTIKHNF